MLPSTNIAFKEWAVVCAALARGRQTIILRKGGIHEGREGFRVEHDQFWLLPTRFHQGAESLTPDALPLLEEVQQAQGKPQVAHGGMPAQFSIRLYAAVESVFVLKSEERLAALAGLHILAPPTVHERFHYRQPGLMALLVRVYAAPQPFEIADSPYIAGCRSWVNLPRPLSTSGLQPVLDDDGYLAAAAAIRRAVAGESSAEPSDRRDHFARRNLS